MRFRGTLVRPLADQADRDGKRIDPAGVQFEAGRDYPLTIEFDRRVPPQGWVTLSREEDGSIVAAGEVPGDAEAVLSLITHHAHGGRQLRLAAGVVVEDMLGDVVRRSRLAEVALTAEHADPAQPAIEEVAE